MNKIEHNEENFSKIHNRIMNEFSQAYFNDIQVKATNYSTPQLVSLIW